MTRRYEFYFRVAKQYFTNEHSKWVKYCFCHENHNQSDWPASSHKLIEEAGQSHKFYKYYRFQKKSWKKRDKKVIICKSREKCISNLVPNSVTSWYFLSLASWLFRPSFSVFKDWMVDLVIIDGIFTIVAVRFCGSKISCVLPGLPEAPHTSRSSQCG